MLVKCSWCQKTFNSERYGRQFCPHCGAELDLPAPDAAESVPEARMLQPGQGAGGVPPQEELPQDQDAPWERRSQLGLVPALLETWKQASLDPKRFFARLKTNDIGDAFLYGWILSTLSYLVGGIWSLPLALMTGEDASIAFAQMIGAPIFSAIGLFLGAGVIHLACMVLGCAGKGFDATFRTVAYAQGPQVLNVVPVLGGLAATIWVAVITIHGLAAMQRTTSGKATAAVILPGVVVLLLCGCAVAVVAFSAAAAFGGGNFGQAF